MPHSRRYLLAATAAAIAAGPLSSVHAASAEAARQLFAPNVTRSLDAQLESIMEENNIPSVEVEILVPSEGQYSFVRGLADIAADISRKRNDPFRIASITKPFAATAILVLVDREILYKTDTISRCIRTFPMKKSSQLMTCYQCAVASQHLTMTRF